MTWTPADYRFEYDGDTESGVWQRLLDAVWRTATDRPGFALVTFADELDTHELRAWMLTVGVTLGSYLPVGGFWPERLGRFDQQVTTRFHRDGAPAESLLTLGYEPSAVASRFFVADACRAAAAAGLSVTEFLHRHNPMQPAGEALLAPVTTELELPPGRACVVVLNNSMLPPDAPRPHVLGVLHKGEIPRPDPTRSRVINSVGWAVEGKTTTPLVPAEAVSEYVTRTGLD